MPLFGDYNIARYVFYRYIIPVPIIKHFISGVEEKGEYVGFCSLGVSCQPTENCYLQSYFRIKQDLTGVLVNKINPLSHAYTVLKKDDVILKFDGVPVASDGSGRLNPSLISLKNHRILRHPSFVP